MRLRKFASTFARTLPALACLGAVAFAAGDDGHMTLAGGRVSLDAPSELALAVTQDQLLVRASPPPCDEGFDYCFYLLEDAYAGTNLRSAGLAVTRRADLRSLTSCLLAQPAGWSGLQPGASLTEGAASGSLGIGTSRFGEIGQGAAGSYTLGDVLRLFDGQECWEFETRLGLTRFENYPPGEVVEFTTEDREATMNLFRSLLDGVTVAGDGVTWPEAGTSDLEEFVRVDLPDEATSPLMLRGEARGTWFFEGSFPVTLVTQYGDVIASGYVMATGDWMSEGFVSFEGEIEFDVKGPTPAVVVLARDNPSGLPEHDAAVRYGVVLR